MTVLADKITPADFLELASANKVQLIDTLAAQMLEIGEQFALKSAEYHGGKARGEKGEAFAEISADFHAAEIRYDMLKHVVSSLQSTLRAERVGMWPEQNR
jgi:hypothetical protein